MFGALILEGVHERSARDRSVFLQLLKSRDHVVVFLFIEGVDPCFDEGQIDLPFPHNGMISASTDIS